MSGQYKVAWLCEALLVSRSGYYDWKARARRPGARQMENMRLRQRIREEFARSRQTYGSPRLAQVIGCPGRRNRIARLMRAERFFARQRSKYRVATTDSDHGGPIAPNRLRGLAVKRPNQVWTTDATCVLTGQGWLYLVAGLGCLHPPRYRLGYASNPRCSAGYQCSAHGPNSTATWPTTHHPLRSGSSVRQRCIPTTSHSTPSARFHESQRQLLR